MVARLLAPQFLLLYWIALSTLVVHFRGKVRHGFLRQLSDHSTLMAPYNMLMYLFSAVPNRPILPTSTIPELAKLRDNWEVIREEALQLFGEGQIKAADKYNDWGFNSFFRSGWKRFYLKWYDDTLRSAACRDRGAAHSIKIKGAMFATLARHRLVTHRDPYAGSLRYHLGSSRTSPGECRIFVDGKCILVERWRRFDVRRILCTTPRIRPIRPASFCFATWNARSIRRRALSTAGRGAADTYQGERDRENAEGRRVGVLKQDIRLRVITYGFSASA